MIRSKFKNQIEIFMIVASQFFLLGGGIVKIFETNADFTYLLVTVFGILVIIFSLLVIDNLFKSIEINENWISIKHLFRKKSIIRKEDIQGYWSYKTLGSLGEEESIYIRLKSGKKIGFHAKAYNNFHRINRGFKSLGLDNLGDYDYEKTYLNHFKIAIPVTFLISLLLFLLSKIL